MATSKKEQSTYSIKAGDIFLTRTSETVDELGMSCVALQDYPEATFSGFVKRLRPTQTDLSDAKFMGFYLRSPMFRKTMTNNAVMVLRASLNEQIFSYLELLLPSLDQQTRIGEFLHLLNAKIELNQRINAELEALAKTIYDYWFVQFDFPDANGRPYKSSGGAMEWNEALKREIPAGWLGTYLSESTQLIRRGISPTYAEAGGTVVLNQKCVRHQQVSFSESRRHARTLSDDDERLLKEYDVVVNSTGVGTLGRVAFIRHLVNDPVTVDSHVTIVRADAKTILPQYLAWSMLRMQPLIERFAEGSTGQVELRKEHLSDQPIVIPDPDTMNRFSKLAEPIDKKIAAASIENEKLTQLLDWLLPMLMNGQVRVR